MTKTLEIVPWNEIKKIQTRGRIVYCIGRKKKNSRMMNFGMHLSNTAQSLTNYNHWVNRKKAKERAAFDPCI